MSEKTTQEPIQQESAGSEELGSEQHQEMIRRQGAFLQQFMKFGVISRAARASEIDPWNHYHWLKTDPSYRKLYQAADERITSLLEDVMMDRALHGREVPITIAGQREVVAEVDNDLLKFALKARRPDKYRERADVTISNLGDLVARLQAGRERAAKAKA